MNEGALPLRVTYNPVPFQVTPWWTTPGVQRQNNIMYWHFVGTQGNGDSNFTRYAQLSR